LEQFDQSFLEEQQKAQRAAIFRVYNYYRILIAFLFLFLFLDPNLNGFVGTVNPGLFQNTIITYIAVNVVIGIATLFVSVNLLAKAGPAFTVVIGDIIALTLLMSASGGVTSGLGNFLFFTLAFAGGLIHGRVSTVLPAIAFILTIYNEFYLFFLNENEVQAFFQAGLLGIVYFVTNILFQTLSNQLRTRQSEVYTLEQINQLIIEGMRTGVVVLTQDNTARLMNNAAERFLLLPDQSIGTLREQLPGVLLEAVDKWNNDPAQREVTFTMDESGVELVATLSELYTPSPEADTLIFLEDSTEVQQQAQQLKLASLGRLSASIAHEIRNPLGAISHAAQLLLESQNIDPSDRRLCEIVQDHSVRMNNVIENVLQMSRRRAPEKIELELRDWLDEFVSKFSAGEIEHADIRIELEGGGSTIVADPGHLSQILGNLCQNGLRYSEKKIGEARILITGSRDGLSGAYYLDVIDYGDGVPQENIDKLFEPFYTTETTGTGLGLYLCRELCAANNALLTYRNTESGGASFRISFRNR
jgi:two-component system, NtrC family, sensor histidine kinase PilS